METSFEEETRQRQKYHAQLQRVLKMVRDLGVLRCAKHHDNIDFGGYDSTEWTMTSMEHTPGKPKIMKMFILDDMRKMSDVHHALFGQHLTFDDATMDVHEDDWYEFVCSVRVSTNFRSCAIKIAHLRSSDEEE